MGAIQNFFLLLLYSAKNVIRYIAAIRKRERRRTTIENRKTLLYYVWFPIKRKPFNIKHFGKGH